MFKSSLLDILADRKASSRVKGTVLVDGVQRSKNFRFQSGYVVQVSAYTYYTIISCVVVYVIVWILDIVDLCITKCIGNIFAGWYCYRHTDCSWESSFLSSSSFAFLFDLFSEKGASRKSHRWAWIKTLCRTKGCTFNSYYTCNNIWVCELSPACVKTSTFLNLNC